MVPPLSALSIINRRAFGTSGCGFKMVNTVLVPPTPSKTVGTPRIHEAGKAIIMPFRRPVKPSGAVFARLVKP